MFDLRTHNTVTQWRTAPRTIAQRIFFCFLAPRTFFVPATRRIFSKVGYAVSHAVDFALSHAVDCRQRRRQPVTLKVNLYARIRSGRRSVRNFDTSK